MSDSDAVFDTSHLYWIGGSPCGGKSTVAERVARQYGLDLYRIDDQIDRLLQTIDGEKQPALTLWQQQTWEQRWMQPVDDLLKFVNQSYDEVFQWCLEEIRAIPASQPTLIEGNPLRPLNISRFMYTHHHAIWLIARDDDLIHFYQQRDWSQDIVKACSNPTIAFENWMRRDVRYAQQVRRECEDNDLTFLMSDRLLSINEKALQVAKHFHLLSDL